MIGKFLDENHPIINEVSDFTINYYDENDNLIKEEIEIDTTFQNIGNMINLNHKEGIEMSILDYGDEYLAVITPISENEKCSYTVVMHS